MSHTILLIQDSSRPDSRTWADYETVTKSLDAICDIFKVYIKRKNPEVEDVTYDLAQLFSFVEKLTDISLMVFNEQTNEYVAHPKNWIKKRLFEHLKSQVQKVESNGIDY